MYHFERKIQKTFVGMGYDKSGDQAPAIGSDAYAQLSAPHTFTLYPFPHAPPHRLWQRLSPVAFGTQAAIFELLPMPLELRMSNLHRKTTPTVSIFHIISVPIASELFCTLAKMHFKYNDHLQFLSSVA